MRPVADMGEAFNESPAIPKVSVAKESGCG